MIAETIPALRSLSPDQKVILAAELWSEAIDREVGEPNPDLMEALRERLAFYRERPDEVASWETVRARIGTQRKPL